MDKREIFKTVEISGRKWRIGKFDAMTGSYMLIKVTGIIAPLLKGLDRINLKDGELPDIKGIDTAGAMSGLSGLSEDDFNYVYNKCLQVCFEDLPGGPAQVLNPNGTFGVIGLDFDAATTLALTAHTLIFNVANFFSGNPLASALGGTLSTK